MADLSTVLRAAKAVLKRHHLCDSCLGRMFSKQLGLKSSRMLGRRLKKDMREPGPCYICRGLLDALYPMAGSMAGASAGYEFDTFAVGAQVKPSIVDRDDLVRSELKLAGTDGIKTEVARDLARIFARRSGRRLDHADPDLTVTVNTRDGSCSAKARPIILYGRYAKTRRGFPQKQQPCANCTGRGCGQCGNHGIDGFDSVEGRISKFIISKFGCSTIRFTWIGGEERSSLVLGDGRPFFARIHDPAKRRPRLAGHAGLGPVELYGCRMLHRLPSMPVRFSSTIRIRVETDAPPGAGAFRSLRQSLKLPVVVYDASGRRSTKSVSRMRYRRTAHGFTLTIDAEGGLPVRRFVHGDDVSPSISQVLGVPCRCAGFDFVSVHGVTGAAGGQP